MLINLKPLAERKAHAKSIDASQLRELLGEAELRELRDPDALDELERRLAAEPGVEQVAFADRLPVMDQFKYRIEVDTAPGIPADGLRRSTLVQVSRGFFEAFGTSVVAGRDFVPLDFETGRVLIVNQSFARHVFGGRNAIGHRVRIVTGEVESVGGKEWYEIVGMVRDFGWQLPEPQEQSAMYRPRLPTQLRSVNLAVRVRDPDAFAPRLRALTAAVDPTIRLMDVQPLTTVGGGEAKMNWALTAVAWVVSGIVLLLSATGIHALMSFTVARRTREIGIRVALGATGREVGRLVVREGLLMTALGIVIGVASALALSRFLASVLYEVRPGDPLTYVLVCGMLIAVALLATWLPARRASMVDPIAALRMD